MQDDKVAWWVCARSGHTARDWDTPHSHMEKRMGRPVALRAAAHACIARAARFAAQQAAGSGPGPFAHVPEHSE